MAQVFISYSRTDKKFVRKLGDALAAQKREAWVDWENIPLTAEWQQKLFTNIESWREHQTLGVRGERPGVTTSSSPPKEQRDGPAIDTGPTRVLIQGNKAQSAAFPVHSASSGACSPHLLKAGGSRQATFECKILSFGGTRFPRCQWRSHERGARYRKTQVPGS